jgi:acetyl esterase/lipase
MQMKIVIFCSFLYLAFSTFAQNKYKLWENGEMPYAKDNSVKEYEKEAWGTMCVFKVSQPTLSVFPAEGKNSGKAVIIFPGGGYSMEAIYHEGYDVAKALSEQGITAAVLKYRLPMTAISDKPQLLPITDAQQAMKMMRRMAEKYGFEKDKVGVMGFSAGAHLAALASSKENERPDFALIIYGCPRLNDENIKWLEDELFHREMTPEEFDEMNLIERVNHKNPPSFLVHSLDDSTCNYLETTLYAQALRENGVENEVHLFPKGGHGFGLGRKEDGTDQWIGLAVNWINRLKLL